MCGQFPDIYDVDLLGQSTGESRGMLEELDRIYAAHEELRANFLAYPYKYEAFVLGGLFMKLPRLKSLKIRSGLNWAPMGHPGTGPEGWRWPQSEVVASGVNSLYVWQEDRVGLLDLQNLVAAVVDSGFQLESLTFKHISLDHIYKGWVLPGWDLEDNSFHSIRKLDFHVHDRFGGDDNDNDAMDVNQVLVLYSSLESISMSINSLGWGFLDFAPFSLTFKDVSWHHLTHLQVSQFRCEPDVLLKFLQARASTLKYLTMRDMNIKDFSVRKWIEVFERMSAVLFLERATFKGNFTGNDSDPIEGPEEVDNYIRSKDNVVGQGQVLKFGQAMKALVCFNSISRMDATPVDPRKVVFEDLAAHNWGRIGAAPVNVELRDAKTLFDIRQIMKQSKQSKQSKEVI